MMVEHYSDAQRATLERLIAIVERLYEETAGFLESGDNQQHWYNRGYANGVIEQLTRFGYGDYVQQHTIPDATDIIAGHEFWAWGKAYQHGLEMGRKETGEVIAPCDKDDGNA